jgi:hypothetical protein|tara:strand:- start:262 stop:495 length:234 start_codon:yes stop_codon:yes gene_type:complete
MVKKTIRKFRKKGLTIHIDKDIAGQYYINGHYPTKRPPDSNKARREFYNKGNLLKNLKRADRNNKKYKTVKALKRSI